MGHPLEKTQSIFQLVLASAPDAMVLINSTGELIYANRKTETLLGYPEEALIGSRIDTLIPGSYQSGEPGFISSFFPEPGSTAMGPGWEFFANTKEGAGIPVSIEATLVDHRQDLILVTIRDLSKRRKTEKRFQALIENNLDAICVHDAEACIQYLSPAAGRLIGPVRANSGTTTIFSFIHPEDRGALNEQLERSLTQPGSPVTGICRLLNNDGKYIWVEGTTTNLTQNDSVRALVTSFRDITARREAEDKLVHANRLYAFISQINQAIVHARNQQEVFGEACRIAVEYGKFDRAWIATVDHSSQMLKLSKHFCAANTNVSPPVYITYNPGSIEEAIIKTGITYVANNAQSEGALNRWHLFSDNRQSCSCITLPIFSDGNVAATFHAVSGERGFFDSDEITLLEEAVADISFAMGIFERDAQRITYEKSLQHNELRLKQAQTIAHIGSWEMDFRTGMSTWSDEFCRIYGLSPKDNLHPNDEWEAYIHPDDQQHVREATKLATALLRDLAVEHRIVRRNGEIRHIFSQATPDVNAEGLAVGLYGVAHDITETKKTKEALALTEYNLRLIMDLIPRPIFAKDIKGNFIFVNRSFAALYGLTPDELIGSNVADIPGNHAASFTRQDAEVIFSGSTKIIPEQPITDYAGNSRILHTIKVPFTVAGSNAKAVLGVCNDITEQKLEEAEKSRMVSDIIQRVKDLEQFSYIVSHNLRAPVANIKGIAEILQIPGLGSEDQKILITDLAACIARLDDVIIDLNFILQVKSKEGLKREHLQLASVIGDIRASIESLIKSENAEIICNFEEINEMYTLRSYLHSIFFNLISNSIKYRRPDISPVIKITSALTGNKIQIKYEDNGIGIDLEKSGAQIFGLYKRFHNHVEGKGMGLFMVKAQVEALNGLITVSSEVNKGTEYFIEFTIN